MTEINFKEYRLDEMKEKFQFPPLNILLIGATGAGKSSTINALLGEEAAKVGFGADPETKEVRKYKINDYLCFYDTPGLGDSPQDDAEHMKKIVSYLNRPCGKKGVSGKLIDKVLVVIDGSTRDFGTISALLNNYIFQGLDAEDVLFAVNQADMAMKGRHWNDRAAEPDAKLTEFLEEKAESVRQRIKESTGKTINTPVFYSAAHGFNITQLIDFIVDNSNSQRKEREPETTTSSSYSDDIPSNGKVAGHTAAGAAAGAAIGSAIPVVGTAVGAAVGGVLGFLSSFWDD